MLYDVTCSVACDIVRTLACGYCTLYHGRTERVDGGGGRGDVAGASVRYSPLSSHKTTTRVPT